MYAILNAVLVRVCSCNAVCGTYYYSSDGTPQWDKYEQPSSGLPWDVYTSNHACKTSREGWHTVNDTGAISTSRGSTGCTGKVLGTWPNDCATALSLTCVANCTAPYVANATAGAPTVTCTGGTWSTEVTGECVPAPPAP